MSPLFHRLSRRVLGAAVLLCFVTSAWTQGQRAGAIRIDRPWTRATPPAASTGAGYLSLTNEGREADRLVGVTSPVAGRAEIHTMEAIDNVARMRWQKDGLALPPGETVELKPGGVHIMFMDLTQPIRPGMRIPITLELQRAGKVQVELLAAPIGAMGAPAAQGGGAEHHGKR